MTKRRYKKIVSAILSTVFFAAGFALFTGVASASIATDLNTDLNLSTAVINLNITAAVEEIPLDIPQDSRRQVLLKIETHPAVLAALEGGEGIPGVRTASADIEEAKTVYALAVANATETFTATTPDPGARQILIDGAVATERDAFKTAEDTLTLVANKLGGALVGARGEQDTLISFLQKEGALSNLVGNTVQSLTNKVEQGQTNFAEQSQGDSDKSTVRTISKEQIDIAGVAKKNADTWNATGTGDKLAIKMQESCSFGFLSLNPMNLPPCFASLVYNLIYIPVSQVLRGASVIFDTILMLSIEGDLVAPKGFIDSTWGVVRDFSNMLFIFILLYTGIMTMFGAGNWRKVVLQVVVIALLINFSLFFTKVVIDAGNVLAVGLRNAIGDTSVSAGIVGSFAPQNFLTIASETESGTVIVVFVIASVVSGFAAYVFFKAALLFIGRLIAFWGLMIISPFAFISMAMPRGNIFDKWLDTLINQAFVAPIFLFFIYIITIAINSGGGILKSFSQKNTGWFESLLGPVIVATIIIMALQKALDLATDMSGDFGKLGSDMASKAMGMTAMVATGGVAALGRGVGGRLAQGLQESGTFQKMATGETALGRFAGRQALTLTDKARTGTWDARGVGLVQKAAKIGGVTNLGTPGAGAKGGFEGAIKRQEDADLKFAKKLEMTDSEKDKIRKEAEAKIPGAAGAVTQSKTRADEASKKVADKQASIDSAKLMGNTNPELEKILEQAKKEEAGAKEALEKDEKTLAELKNTDELIKKENDKRRKSYATYIEGRGQVVGEIAGAAGMAGLVAGGIAAGPVGAIAGYTAGIGAVAGTYSNEQAQKTAAKVRSGETAKSEKDHAKKAKELAKELEDAKKEGADDKIVEHIEKKIKAHDEKE